MLAVKHLPQNCCGATRFGGVLERVVDALEARLKTAQARLRALMEQLPDSDPRAELDAAHADLLAAERALAAARGEEYAIPLKGLPPSDVGAPLPHLLADGRRALLAYYVAEPDPDWDGMYVTVIDPAENREALLAVVEFTGYLAVRMGLPNDEALKGHPLYSRGLEAYAMHLVVNSSWITELERVNSVHPCHEGGWHTWARHYLFTFHDETFECIARGHEVRLERTGMRSLLERLAGELVNHS
jgi:hypothetical protein